MKRKGIIVDRHQNETNTKRDGTERKRILRGNTETGGTEKKKIQRRDTETGGREKKRT